MCPPGAGTVARGLSSVGGEHGKVAAAGGTGHGGAIVGGDGPCCHPDAAPRDRRAHACPRRVAGGQGARVPHVWRTERTDRRGPQGLRSRVAGLAGWRG